MVLYNEKQIEKRAKIERPIETLNLHIEELPERPTYDLKSNMKLQKFVKTCEAHCRKSQEYREYMDFLKKYMDYKRCAILKGLKIENGKKYTIEIHHTPFTLFDICLAVITKRLDMHEPIHPFYIAEEVMQLHYDGKVGLVPLSITMHQCIHDDQVFLPLQYVYQEYGVFFDEYEPWIDPMTKDKVELYAQMSVQSEGEILSNVINPTFTYLEIDGITLPQIPEEWGQILKTLDFENAQL